MASSFPLLSSVQSIAFVEDCDALRYSPMAHPSCEHQVTITRQDGAQKVIEDLGRFECSVLVEALDSKVNEWAKDHFSQKDNPYFAISLYCLYESNPEQFAEKLLSQWFA